MKLNHQNQMKLSQLKVLVAVAEQGNFTEAAAELDMSQSAVSHAIAALEALLGISLLARGRQGARLTPAGKRIVEHAREVVQRTELISREADVAKGLQGGQVRLASFRSVAVQVLPAVIAQFHQRFPAIAVSLTEQDDCLDVEQALQSGRADIGLTLLPASAELETWELLRDEFVALLPPNFVLATPHLTWEALISQPLILPPANYAMMRPVHTHAQALGHPLTIAYEVGIDATIVSLVAQGLGASILPRLAATPIPANVQVFQLPQPLERVIGAAVVAEALHPPAVYAFLEILQEELAGCPAIEPRAV